MIMDRFNATEQSEILEIARVVLGDKDSFYDIVDNLDIDEDYLKTLQEKINEESKGKPDPIPSCFNCDKFAVCRHRYDLEGSDLYKVTGGSSKITQAIGQTCICYKKLGEKNITD